jgi:hypothetical protein
MHIKIDLSIVHFWTALSHYSCHMPRQLQIERHDTVLSDREIRRMQHRQFGE